MTPVKRKRGGASHPCPECGCATFVRNTWRVRSGKVVRSRECWKDPSHVYYTTESFAGWGVSVTLANSKSPIPSDRFLRSKFEVA